MFNIGGVALLYMGTRCSKKAGNTLKVPKVIIYG